MFYQHLQVGASIPSLPSLPLESFVVKGFFFDSWCLNGGEPERELDIQIPNHDKATLRLSKHILVLVGCFDDNNLWDLLCVLPQNLTWNLKMMVSKRNVLLQGLLFRFHVKFQGCNIFFRCIYVIVFLETNTKMGQHVPISSYIAGGLHQKQRTETALVSPICCFQMMTKDANWTMVCSEFRCTLLETNLAPENQWL